MDNPHYEFVESLLKLKDLYFYSEAIYSTMTKVEMEKRLPFFLTFDVLPSYEVSYETSQMFWRHRVLKLNV
jgi:hypothetical protein